MKINFIKIVTAAFIAIFGILAFAPTSSVSAATDICSMPEVSEEVKAAAGCPGTTSNTLENSIQIILNSIIGIAGLIAVIFIVIGGVTYMTSTGDAGKIKKAKDTILYAVIGLVVCALAFIIVNWAISIVSNSSSSTPSSDPDTVIEEEEDGATSYLSENSLAFLDKKL